MGTVSLAGVGRTPGPALGMARPGPRTPPSLERPEILAEVTVPELHCLSEGSIRGVRTLTLAVRVVDLQPGFLLTRQSCTLRIRLPSLHV